MKSLVDAAGVLVRRHWWWMISSLAIAVGLGLTFGYVGVWVGYVVFNNVGVWVAVDSHRFARRGPRSWMAWCAIILLPVGPIGLFISGGGMTPIEMIASGSPDEETRKETARALSRGLSGPFGSP